MEFDNNEQAKELIRLFSGIEDKRDVYKLFKGILRYIVIQNAGNEKIFLPEIGELKLKISDNNKVYMSIYPFEEFEKFIVDCNTAQESEDFASSPLYRELRKEKNMILKSKL
jgi:hypothetical protein